MNVARMGPWSIAPPLAGGALHAAGSGLFHTLLPLRLVAVDYGGDVVGLVVMAEGAGFLVGCLGAVKLIRSVGEVRAYAAFAAASAVLVLSLGAGPTVVAFMAIQAVAGFANAGQSVVIESWLNALVPNARRGFILTLYVLVLGLFYGLGQLLARDIDPAGDGMLMITAALYALALVPVTAVQVSEPRLHAPVGLHLLKAFKVSPTGTLACLLAGLVSATFSSIGPLYDVKLGFGQSAIVLLMAALQLGALFLQFPIGFLSDKLDRRVMLIVMAAVQVAVCGLFFAVDSGTPFAALFVLFSLFGGLAETFYPLGVAHANDRAKPDEFVVVSSNLLLMWALGSAVGPPIAAFAMERFGADAFFAYAILLTVGFAAVAGWRMLKAPPEAEREEFVAYPQTSPAVYEWARPEAPAAVGTPSPANGEETT